MTRLATRNPSDMPAQVSQSGSKAHIGRASRVLRDDSGMNGMPVLLREDYLYPIKTAICRDFMRAPMATFDLAKGIGRI